MAEAIKIERFTKHYGPRRVVDNVSLTIPTGCVYGFLGRNGAGKSTLIKMLMGMVQPDAGRASLLGEDICELRPATRARIAYLAEGHPLYRWMTVAGSRRVGSSFGHPVSDRLQAPPSLQQARLRGLGNPHVIVRVASCRRLLAAPYLAGARRLPPLPENRAAQSQPMFAVRRRVSDAGA